MDARVLKALHQLESRMGEEIFIQDVAASVGLSLFHFHRLFHEATGETPAEYRRRVRLDAAALRLRWTCDSAGEVAHALGYTSQAAFCRAFRDRFGMTPRQFRFDSKRWPPLPVDRLLRQIPTLRDVEAWRFLARRYVGPYSQVPAHWREFLRDLPAGFERDEPDSFLGLVYDDPRFTPPEQIRYDCCVLVFGPESFDRVQLARLNLHEMRLRPGRYACLPHRGPYREIGNSFSRLLDHWIASSGYTITEDPAIELYRVPHGRVPDEELSILLMLFVEQPPKARARPRRGTGEPPASPAARSEPMRGALKAAAQRAEESSKGSL